MRRSDGEAALTPEESWEAIQDTVDRVRSSMYVAGSATILLLWGAIVSVGLLAVYAIVNQASESVVSSPWTHALLWGGWVQWEWRAARSLDIAPARRLRSETRHATLGSGCSCSGWPSWRLRS